MYIDIFLLEFYNYDLDKQLIKIESTKMTQNVVSNFLSTEAYGRQIFKLLLNFDLFKHFRSSLKHFQIWFD